MPLEPAAAAIPALSAGPDDNAPSLPPSSERRGGPDRRHLLKLAGALGAANLAATGFAGAVPAAAQPAPRQGAPQATRSGPAAAPGMPDPDLLRKKTLAFTLAHEQFGVPELVANGAAAAAAGFGILATSDHFQPWQANEGHAGEAWVTMAAMGAQTGRAWMGTAVTCPTMRYNPAVVAEAFASLAHLYPGRIFLGVGSGEALNEQAATGMWPAWREHWERLIEAIGIIRALWRGETLHHKGKYYSVDARLYNPPPRPIPLLTAANGPKAMRLAGLHGDGLISDPLTWKQHKAEWEAGARDAGKNPTEMPVMIEQFVAVGDAAEAKQAAELWRFLPKAFKGYENIVDPAEIQKRAEAEIPLEKLTGTWPVGNDPETHLKTIKELWASGVTVVNIHSGQPDQRKVIEFYANRVIPSLRQQG